MGKGLARKRSQTGGREEALIELQHTSGMNGVRRVSYEDRLDHRTPSDKEPVALDQEVLKTPGAGGLRRPVDLVAHPEDGAAL